MKDKGYTKISITNPDAYWDEIQAKSIANLMRLCGVTMTPYVPEEPSDVV